MNEKKGSAETVALLKALLTNYSSLTAAANKSHYSLSYLSHLRKGRRIAGKEFCDWVKAAHPELKPLCGRVLLSRLME